MGEVYEPDEYSEVVDGLEQLRLVSAGVDVGSSTSSIEISRLTLRRRGRFSARFEVVSRRVQYRSPILLTPYASSSRIDVAELKRFADRSYREAGVIPEEVDTGAVLITGEALKKENARAISESLALHSGRFVCVSAGPNHEAVLAAHGSGAVDMSRDSAGVIVNLDVGGGTTKIALARGGAVIRTAAISVGARLMALDAAGRVMRIDEPASRLAASLGLDVKLGDFLPEEDRRRLADVMAKLVLEAGAGERGDGLLEDMAVPGAELFDWEWDAPQAVVFSGGVSEYVYLREDESFGDLGPELGQAIRRELERRPSWWERVRPPRQGIRATVTGAAEYSLQASGVTSYVSDVDVLPVGGLKVVKATVTGDEAFDTAFASALRKVDKERMDDGLIAALAFETAPDYSTLRHVAEVICGMTRNGERTCPIWIVLDDDLARCLGAIVKEELDWPAPVVAVDGIVVGELDYIDIGRPMGMSGAVPVTVKSLTFPAANAGSGHDPPKADRRTSGKDSTVLEQCVEC